MGEVAVNRPLSRIIIVKKNSRLVLSCVFAALFMVGVAFVVVDTRMYRQQSTTQDKPTPANAVLSVNENQTAPKTDAQSTESTSVPYSDSQGSGSPSAAHTSTRKPAQSSAAPAQTEQTGNTQPSPGASPMPPASLPNPIVVQLSVNGNSVGPLTVDGGSNHCDVLNAALRNGLISSLDMRYFGKPLYSYGVYAINGQGDTKQVYWVYTVNGKSPPYGCSRVQAVSGDNINWKYIGR